MLSLNSEKYIIERKTTSGVAPAPRSSHAAALIGDFVMIFGGCDHDQDFNDLLILDTSNPFLVVLIDRNIYMDQSCSMWTTSSC